MENDEHIRHRRVSQKRHESSTGTVLGAPVKLCAESATNASPSSPDALFAEQPQAQTVLEIENGSNPRKVRESRKVPGTLRIIVRGLGRHRMLASVPSL